MKNNNLKINQLITKWKKSYKDEWRVTSEHIGGNVWTKVDDGTWSQVEGLVSVIFDQIVRNTRARGGQEHPMDDHQ